MTDQHQHRASINLNDDVKVKLTDYGRDLLAKKRLTRQPDEAGYIKFQLWELMNIFGSYVCNGCSIPCNGCSIPFTFNRILLAPFNPAMTDQLRARVEALEELHKAVVDLNERFNLDPLVARVEALEARYETQRQATLEWSKNVARLIMELEAGQKTKPSPAVDRVSDLRDQISSGPECSLVERVARRLAYEHDISPNWEDEARIAIREVAAALIDWHDSDEVVRTAYEAGQWLKREANA